MLVDSLGELVGAWSSLKQAVGELSVIADDRPSRRRTLLGEQLEDAITQLASTCDEGLALAEQAEQASRRPGLETVKRGVAGSQRALNAVQQVLASGPLSAPGLVALQRHAEEVGGEWPSWLQSFVRTLELCSVPVQATQESMLTCWRELVEKAERSSISVSNEAVGQKVFVGSKAEQEVADEYASKAAEAIAGLSRRREA